VVSVKQKKKKIFTGACGEFRNGWVQCLLVFQHHISEVEGIVKWMDGDP
jgi:hypothetical protein